MRKSTLEQRDARDARRGIVRAETETTVVRTIITSGEMGGITAIRITLPRVRFLEAR